MVDFKERLVLMASSTQGDVHQLAWDCDWELHDIGSTSEELYVDVWSTQDRAVEVHYVEDGLVGLGYITLRGGDVTGVAEQVTDRLDVWTPREALAALQQVGDRNERLRLIYAAALSARGQIDQSVIDTFREIARHDRDPGIRQAIIVSAGYLPRPELVELVKELRDNDPVEHLRHNAQVMLDGLSIDERETRNGS